MPQVKGGAKGKSGGKAGAKGAAKKPTPARDAVVKQTTDVSSIIMGGFLLLAVVVGAAAWMGRSISVIENQVNLFTDGVVKTVGLSVDTIRVYQAAPDQETRIRQALGVQIGDNMFRANPSTLKDRLEKVGGLGDIQVHRFWPGQISIFITPLEATVLYWDGQQHLPMNINGDVVPDVDLAAQSFPMVTGEGSVKASAELLADLEAFPLLLSKLGYADRINDRRWDLVMRSKVRVQLPAGAARFHALERLANLQRETGLLDRRVERIDLRDPDRIYTRRGQLSAGLASTGSQG